MATTTSTTPTATETPSPSGVYDAEKNCYSAVPGKNGYVPLGSCNSYYNFEPRLAPAVATATIFGILTVSHLVLAILHKKPYAWVLIMGAAWETLAFALNAAGSQDQQNIAYATSHIVLYLLAPLWINGFVYMTFGRMVHFFLPEQKVMIKASWMSGIFISADILTFIIQGVGGVMATPGADADTIKLGLRLYLVGLGVQEGFIVVFLVLMLVFHWKRLQLDKVGVATTYPEGSPKKAWKSLQFAMYAVLVLISIRIFFRIAEFAGGIEPSNPIPFHEEYSYSLDAFPMMVCLLILTVFHPGRVITGPGSSFPTRKEKKQMKQERKEAKEKQKRGGGVVDGHIELGSMAAPGQQGGSYYYSSGSGSSDEAARDEPPLRAGYGGDPWRNH